MTRTVPQTSYAAVSGARYDCCWTPWHGAAPLFPYIPAQSRIWEPCAGAGWLVRWLEEAGHTVIATDYHDGHDARAWAPEAESYDLIITNPPWSLKYQFIERLYHLGKPWALLVPISTPLAATAKKARDMAGQSWEELRLDKRINFHMPGSGFVNNGAQVMSLWLCHGLLPAPIIEATVPDPRPEHRLIKPAKRRKARRADAVAWATARGVAQVELVADLLMEAISTGIPLDRREQVQLSLFEHAL